ncbi:MAG TPA: hypothetical protein DCF61_08895 [Alphaproteobacteria bacterium]|nr:hypothetical protein [Alphaproteobacteria bacterium]
MSRPARLIVHLHSCVLLLVGLLLVGTTARAGDDMPSVDYAAINKALIEDHVIVRYGALADAAEIFATTVKGYCAGGAGSEEKLADARAAYQGLTDAWAGVAHIRFGPVELLMRGARFYFWPQGRGRIAAALTDLMASADRQIITRERFRFASVAAQGLPAAAFLLHPDAAEQPRMDRCLLLPVIADNLEEIAAGLLSDWRDGANGFARVAMTPGPDNDYFDSHAEVTLSFLKALHTGLQSIADIELKQVLRDPQLAFLPPAGRELRTMRITLAALAEIYLGTEDGRGISDLVEQRGVDPALDPLMRKAFRMTRETADTIALPLPRAVRDETEREKVEKLLTQITALRQIVERRLARAVDLQIGFNALDGD